MRPRYHNNLEGSLTKFSALANHLRSLDVVTCAQSGWCDEICMPTECLTYAMVTSVPSAFSINVQYNEVWYILQWFSHKSEGDVAEQTTANCPSLWTNMQVWGIINMVACTGKCYCCMSRVDIEQSWMVERLLLCCRLEGRYEMELRTVLNVMI
jgi:hypothetical protein